MSTKNFEKKECSSSKTQNILDNIKQALDLNEEDSIKNIYSETSKVSIESTLTDSSSCSKENNKMNDFYNSFDYFQFEQNFHTYYVDSSKNNNGNYDNYVKNALKLISLIPFEKLGINQRIEEISKTINFQCLQNSNKKLLLLDLDESLIHADLDFSLEGKIKYDTILYFDSEEEKDIPIPLIIRPDLYQFLNYVSKEFDLVIFTASDQQYADTIINYIEKDKKYFKMRLYRNHCIFIEPGLFIKDLRIFSDIKKMEDIIILDNSLFSFANQLNNGILITSFFYDKTDIFLRDVTNYLDYIKNEKDIRDINKQSFRFEDIKEDIIMNSN
jgi:CTD small phosphatase-like protein 2